MKIIILFFMMTVLILAQNYKVVQVKGDVKFQTGTAEEWNQLKEGIELSANNFISTGEKSSVQLKGIENSFTLGEMSAVSLGSIKSMSTDELLLALAMEDMINVPKPNGKNNSSSTAAYGEEEKGEKQDETRTNNFSIMRLNGAMQLAKSGMKESSIVFAKETYRKYPETKRNTSYRIFFADILYEKGLFEEALSEYFEIEKLDLTNEEKTKVEARVNSINKILLNN